MAKELKTMADAIAAVREDLLNTLKQNAASCSYYIAQGDGVVMQKLQQKFPGVAQADLRAVLDVTVVAFVDEVNKLTVKRLMKPKQ
jgi:hypothetical protein